jgi:hypothetical protein
MPFLTALAREVLVTVKLIWVSEAYLGNQKGCFNCEMGPAEEPAVKENMA